MSIDERPLRRSIRVKIQLIVIVALVVIFVWFVMSQLREINVVRANINSERNKITAEQEFKEHLSKEYDFIKDKEFIIQQGRDRLGLVMENDILYIKQTID